MQPARLIVVNGPIASGKTTVGRAVASSARAMGIMAAAIDMDDLIEVLRGNDWSTPWSGQNWRMARGLAAGMIDRLIEQDVSVIALAGPFFNQYERDELCDSLLTKPSVRFVTLEASLEETQRRCAADDDRVVTKDPAFVARIYAGIDWTALPPDDLLLSTEKLSVEDVVEAIATDVGLR